jgi:hypothetical protein
LSTFTADAKLIFHPLPLFLIAYMIASLFLSLFAQPTHLDFLQLDLKCTLLGSHEFHFEIVLFPNCRAAMINAHWLLNDDDRLTHFQLLVVVVDHDAGVDGVRSLLFHLSWNLTSLRQNNKLRFQQPSIIMTN